MKIKKIDLITRKTLQNAIEIGKAGSLFIIGKPQKKYWKTSYKKIGNLNILNDDDNQVIKKLAEIDGATIIDENGNLKAYGVTVKTTKHVLGHGKRHASAAGISQHKTITILSSEEDGYVRVFKNGSCIEEINAKTKLPTTTIQKLANFINHPDIRALTAGGVALSIIAAPLTVPFLVFTGTYFLVNKSIKAIK
ncbi:MAG: DNA integrity scanning protein DisA nucleotide-binding domain protein [Candidatus Marsarchaeota archaeon]|nr:DNA integrity scanning protein DisA nucleotide-binding domain protein [Candidatus Marsarchaeota archaeon]